MQAVLTSIPGSFALLSTSSLLETLDSLERISRALGMLQAVAALAVQERNLAAEPERHFSVETASPERSEFRNVADFLQHRLRISKSEARRRIHLAGSLLPKVSLTGETLAPKYPELASEALAGRVGSEALALSVRALDEVALRADEPAAQAMESNLSQLACQHDTDFLRPVIQRWHAVIDQNGAQPTEAELKQRQGIWRMRSHRGLEHFHIWADQPQAEVLHTVLNAGTNPRAETMEERALDGRSLPQKHLDTLTSALKAALRSDLLPRSGGTRPQLLAIVAFKELFGEFKGAESSGPEPGTSSDPPPAAASASASAEVEPAQAAAKPAGHAPSTARFAFTGPVNAKNIRALACEADIIPVIFGGQGQILDVGASNRFFDRTQRAALTARDRGCSFPRCTIPAPWCEAHHVDWWSRNPWTAVDNGALLCSHHHRLVHQEDWKIQMRSGIPWFIPPPWIDPQRGAQRNVFHQI